MRRREFIALLAGVWVGSRSVVLARKQVRNADRHILRSRINNQHVAV
jgi:hypothetical protein